MTDNLLWCVECGNVVRSSNPKSKPGPCPACGSEAEDEDYPFAPFYGEP